jgi:phosphonate degradation associated HDIG domain protein
MSDSAPPADLVDEIFAAFAARGADHYGEGVSQLEHALQCAALAEADGAAGPMVAAALLHDYGHLFDGRGDAAEREARDARHEAHGAAALRRWFGSQVTGPIALHVAAKRYLCAAEPGYMAALSPASALSLRLQGGPFGAEAARRFASRRFATDAVRLRRWDDRGKVAGARTSTLETYRPLLRRLARPPVSG